MSTKKPSADLLIEQGATQMTADLAAHPFSPQSVARESGAIDHSERAWNRFFDACERLLGHGLDGCDDFTARANNVGCGYSIDEAFSAFEGGDTPAQYVARVKHRERYDHGAFVAA